MSDSEDDYAEYGTPLDPLDEDAVPKKRPFKLEEIVARNNKQRFHGAFTGGFSAGFFNTVGSLEGWKPANFKSSRSEKAERKQQRPEDFMDEEDIGEFGIAPRVLRATSDYADHTAGRKRERVAPSSGPIPGEPVLRQLIQPVKETVGVKLLKRMGWKPGQGVGPRLTRKEKKLHRQEVQSAGCRVYGCSLPDTGGLDSGGDSGGSSDEENIELTFAPDDYEPFLVKAKDNCFGIGYSGLEKRSVLSGHVNLFQPSSLVMNEKNKKVSISGQAFGVGALEEEDEDIYALEDMSQYDFSLGNKEVFKKMEGNKAAKDRIGSHDEPLEGFVVASNPVSRRKFFPPPPLPSSYEPLHRTRKSRWDQTDNQVSQEDVKKKGLQRHALSASDRAVILEEKQILQLNVPEEEDVSEKKKLAIEAAKMTEELSSGSNQALFRPFAAYPDKQRRYEQYVALVKEGRKGDFSRVQPLDMTEWQRGQELAEFERVERLASFMDDRFVPESKGGSVTPREKETPASEIAARAKMFGKLTRECTVWKPTSLLCKRFNVPEPGVGTSESSGRKKGVSKYSVFDFLDVASQNFRPANMLSDEVKVPADTTLHVKAASSMEREDPIIEEVPLSTGSTIQTAVSESRSTQAVGSQEIEFPNPPSRMDLYKAVFLSSSEESGSESDEGSSIDPKMSEGDTHKKPFMDLSLKSSTTSIESILPAPAEFLNTPAASVNVLRNTSPPRGLFANLDLDAINQQIREARQRNTADVSAPTSRVTAKVEEEKTATKEKSGVVEELCGMYGPSLPTAPLTPAPRKPTPLSMLEEPASFMWVEKKSKSSHKDRHKKDHKKSSKHKKHKSKKHKKKY